MRKVFEGLSAHLGKAAGDAELASSVVLTGGDWAPVMCRLIESESRQIRVMQYGISPNWPKLKYAQHNIYAQMLAVDTSKINATIILATHKQSGRSANFNKKAARELAEAGWTVKWARQSRLLHAKVWLFGQGIAVSGSHNVGYASASENVDVSVVTDSLSARVQLSKIFSWQWGLAEKRGLG